MHVKSLKVFCDVAGRQSFSRAADENGISQSGASQMVQHLEERLGVTLIDRSKRPLVLTPEGEVFYRGCRKLVRGYSALEDEVRTLHEDVEGLVRVACIYSVGLSHMNHYVQDFQDRHPKANVRVEYEHPDKVYELVEHDQVDLGLVSYPQSSRSVRATAWRDEPMVLVCAPGHGLSSCASISPQQLHGVKMVGFDEGLRIRRAIDRALAAHGAEARVVMEFDNIETIKRAIEIDAGVGILPLPTVTREIEAGTLVAVPLKGSPVPTASDLAGQGLLGANSAGLTRPLVILQRRGKRLGATARQFLRALQERAELPSAGDMACGDSARSGEAALSNEVETVR